MNNEPQTGATTHADLPPAAPPCSIAPLMERVAAAIMDGRAGEDRQLVEAMLALAPDHAPALHLAGIAHARTGDFSGAIELLEKALRLQPETGPWLRDLATAQ